jgi:DNA-directed RNA polymerase II subunit RPB11
MNTQKVEYISDENIVNAGTFVFQDEDHTLGNTVRHYLCKNPEVKFAGYKIPHPLENKMILKIQTSDNTSPHEAIVKSINDIIGEFTDINQQVENAEE